MMTIMLGWKVGQQQLSTDYGVYTHKYFKYININIMIFFSSVFAAFMFKSVTYSFVIIILLF
jgi:hypothetical protein